MKKLCHSDPFTLIRAGCGRNLGLEIALLRFLIPLCSIRNDIAIARLTSRIGMSLTIT